MASRLEPVEESRRSTTTCNCLHVCLYLVRVVFGFVPEWAVVMYRTQPRTCARTDAHLMQHISNSYFLESVLGCHFPGSGRTMHMEAHPLQTNIESPPTCYSYPPPITQSPRAPSTVSSIRVPRTKHPPAHRRPVRRKCLARSRKQSRTAPRDTCYDTH